MVRLFCCFVLFFLIIFTAQDEGQKIDVTALLVGLIAAGVAIIIVGLLVWYTCQNTCKNK